MHSSNRFHLHQLLLLLSFSFLLFMSFVSCSLTASAKLRNVHFLVQGNINSYNHTITLKSSRILLRKEVSKSKLILRKGSNRFTASFSSLSKDGKKVTYILSHTTAKKLSPRTGKYNGKYQITSSLFSQKLSITYRERIQKETVTGFVLQENGSPISHALIQAKRNNKVISKTYTDSKGYYQIQAKGEKESLSIAVSHSEYYPYTLSSVSFQKNNTVCENFILRKKNSSHFTMEFQIKDMQKKPVSDATIQIFSKHNLDNDNNSDKTKRKIFSSEHLLFTGTTNDAGNLTLSTFQTIPNKTSCTIFNGSKENKISYKKEFLFQQKSHTYPCQSTKVLNPSTTYTIRIFKEDATGRQIFADQLVDFSFQHIITNAVSFSLILSPPDDTLPVNHLSTKWDSESSFFSLSKMQIQLYKRGYSHPIIMQTIPKNRILQNGDILSIPFSYEDFPLYESFTYSLRIKALDEKDNCLADSDIIPIASTEQLFQNVFLLTNRFGRILCYGNILEDSPQPQNAVFALYEKQNTNDYYFIDYFKTTPFIKCDNYDMASLPLSALHIGKEYLIVSESGAITTNDSLSFFADTNNTLLRPVEDSFPPIANIYCQKNRENQKSVSQKTTDFFFSHFSSHYPFSQKEIRKSMNYPNCIYACYKKNGQHLACILSSKPAQVGTPYPVSIAKKENIIIDILSNDEAITTNQKSYQ